MTKSSLTVVLSFLLLTTIVKSQTAIDVADLTLKIGVLSEEKIYYGFAAGDQIVFNFNEIDDKELKEVEILEYPINSKFAEYKVSKIVNKKIMVYKNSVFCFRFYNGHILKGRVCKIQIQRIPASNETKLFNPNIKWQMVSDTTKYVVKEYFPIKSDTNEVQLIDQIAKISSRNALNGNTNKNVISFDLPDSTKSWSYYIGVGNEGKAEYRRAEKTFLNMAGKTLGFTPMGMLALNGVSLFNVISGADNVKYWFILDWDNVTLFKQNQQFMQYKGGDVVNGFGAMNRPTSGKVHLGLLNDNLAEPIDVIVKVSAIVIKTEYEGRNIEKLKIENKKIPVNEN